MAKVCHTSTKRVIQSNNTLSRKAKTHKSKPKNKGEDQTKRGGGGENGKINMQLAPLGLKVVKMIGDGNCFFRAIADQLEGNQNEHAKYRRMVVDYIEEHREEFEPFLEDGISFHEYCKNMRKDATWAGHMELQAISLTTRCNICIHRIMFPRWQILNFQNPNTPLLQLSYHAEEHYDSVRLIDDGGVGPPKLETIKAIINEQPDSCNNVEGSLSNKARNGKAKATNAITPSQSCSSSMKHVDLGVLCI